MSEGKIPQFWKPVRRAVDGFASVLFPAPCHICRQPLETASRIPICVSCIDSLQRIEPPMCQQCGRPFPPSFAAAPSRVCRLCASGLYNFDFARSFARYDATMQRLVTLLKYSPVAPLGKWLALQMEPIVRRDPVFQKAGCVVAVPLDRSRMRERGYNQAELIARPLARRLDLPLATNFLWRLRSRPPHLKLTRRERWETVRGAFQAHEGGRVDKSHILLVDDVLTSGATLDACARALRSAGAQAVYAITVARVIPAGEPAALVPPAQPSERPLY